MCGWDIEKLLIGPQELSVKAGEDGGVKSLLSWYMYLMTISGVIICKMALLRKQQDLIKTKYEQVMFINHISER